MSAEVAGDTGLLASGGGPRRVALRVVIPAKVALGGDLPIERRSIRYDPVRRPG